MVGGTIQAVDEAAVRAVGARRLPVWLRRQGIAAALTTLLVLLLAVPLGLVYAWLAPTVDYGAVLARPESALTRLADADATLVACSLVLGVVVGALTWLLTRRRGLGPGVSVGLAVGGLAAAYVAARLGMRIHLGDPAYKAFIRTYPPDQQVMIAPLVRFAVRAPGLLVTLPLVSLAVHALLVGLGPDSDDASGMDAAGRPAAVQPAAG